MRIMVEVTVARTASGDAGRWHNPPVQTLLYRIVEEYYPVFTAGLAAQGKELPDYVQRGFETNEPRALSENRVSPVELPRGLFDWQTQKPTVQFKCCAHTTAAGIRRAGWRE
jgi:hypothetical protein